MVPMTAYYYSLRDYQRAWEAIRAQEWERMYRRWLDTYRRMVLYHLQWGTPTGPYWAPIPSRPWWMNGEYWRQLKAMAIGSPPYPLTSSDQQYR